jgi:nitrate reductase gamma subunit
MTFAVYLILCLSSAVLVVASAVRAVIYARAPMHLRWELYPVPHEAPGRAAHGGSYFEQSAWWAHRSPARHGATIKATATELLFLPALREFNRPLWRRSFPFHFGLYLLIVTAALVVAAASLTILAPAAAAGLPGLALRALASVTGIAGLVLAPIGALALLHRRLTDSELRPSTVPADLFNLAAFAGALILLGAGFALGAPGPVAIAVGLFRWDTAVSVPPLLAAGLAATALLAAYVPFTHMSHFIGKYFTYHAVRWDDAVNRRGSAIERRMAVYLTYRPTWAAPHVAADGVRTWADVAATHPPENTSR